MASTNFRVIRSSSPWLSSWGLIRDSPLGAAVGNVHDGGFPGHERGQGAHLVRVDFVVIAQAPLHRPAGTVVLHAVADKGRDFAVVALEGHLDLEFALGNQQQGLHVFRQAHQIGGVIEIADGRLVLAHRSSLRPRELTADFR